MHSKVIIKREHVRPYGPYQSIIYIHAIYVELNNVHFIHI